MLKCNTIVTMYIYPCIIRSIIHQKILRCYTSKPLVVTNLAFCAIIYVESEESMTEMLRKFMQSVHKDARWITPVDKKVIHQWIKLSTGGRNYPQGDKVIHKRTKKLSTEVIHMSNLVPNSTSPSKMRQNHVQH